jgi:hypothetical protein
MTLLKGEVIYKIYLSEMAWSGLMNEKPSARKMATAAMEGTKKRERPGEFGGTSLKKI